MSGSDTQTWEGKEPPRLNPEELTELARQVVTNVVFITNDTHVLNSAFGVPFAFLPKEARHFISKIGAVYEEYANVSSGRSVNGYPTFFSFKAVHQDDLEALLAEIDRLEEALGISKGGADEVDSVRPS